MSGGVKEIRFGQTGFTLIELLVVVAIIGIIVLVGINMMGGVLAKHRVGAAAGELTTRLRAAKMLSVVRNRPVTVIFNTTGGTNAKGSYYACLDTDTIGDCTDGGDDYLSIDTGREVGTRAKSEISLHSTLNMYAADFGDGDGIPAGGVDAVTYLPPSGLPVNIKSGGPFVNGVVCLEAEIGDSGAWAARFAYRRITVNPIVGKSTLWKNTRDIVARPDCRNNPEDDLGWEKTF